METHGTCVKDTLDSTCNRVENFTSIHYMFKTKYKVSFRPKLIVSYLAHEVLLPNFLLRYLTGGCVRLSVDAEDTTSESFGGARWHPSVGGGSGQALWLPVTSALLQWVMLQWVRSRGLWLPGPMVLSVPAGGLCGIIPQGHGIHESGSLHQRTANHGHSFGCQQDEPSASLVTTNRIYNVY